MKVNKSRLKSFRMHGALLLQRPKATASTALTSARNKQNEYVPLSIIGKGAFGVVFCARGKKGEIVAIKKVLIDPRFKNRELEIIKVLKHPNCISLKESFNSPGKARSEYFLNLVMEYMPETLHDFNTKYCEQRLYPPIMFIKLFAYQMLCGLSYMHARKIVHRDIKPQNILINVETGVLRICDFGSAKIIKNKERSVAYIASRYYRAPELILDYQEYSEAIDLWSVGCVIAETINAGQPIFSSETSMGMMDSIMSVLGQPTKEDLFYYQGDFEEITKNAIQKSTIEQSLPPHTPPDLLDLLKQLFFYNPNKRITAYVALGHPCFQEIFKPGLLLPSGKKFPTLEKLSDPKL